MANKKGKSIDTTCLPIVGHTASRGYIHRDYLAHCLRYTHVARYLREGKRYRTAHVLDVGCGREAPLARLMFSMMFTHTTGSYTGVDYGLTQLPETIPNTERFRAFFHSHVDFASTFDLQRTAYDVITCFEVLEHVEALHAFKMLRKMRDMLVPSGVVFVSTPCYSVKAGAASNHVNEMTFQGFGALLRLAGFSVERVWGTFANQRDYKHLLATQFGDGATIFDELSSYYDSEVLACLFAPLYPAQARNCLWRVRATTPKFDRTDIKTFKGLTTPEHGSSALWPRQLKQIIKEAAGG